jgi:divalent metal cation (Fe/Co/Zn/Cd) transporter
LAINRNKQERIFSSGLMLWGCTCLAIIKGTAGWLTGSTALLADGFRSGGEAIRWHASRRAAGGSAVRRSGTSRSAAGSALTPGVLAAMFLLLIGVELGLFTIRELVEGSSDAPEWYAAAILAAAWLIRIAMSSDSRRAESICSAVVLAGTGMAWLGGRIGETALYYADECAALWIAVSIAKQGYRQLAIGANGSRTADLFDRDASELSEAVQRVDGVIAIEQLEAKEQGHYIAVELTISVNPRITISEGQDIARRVKDRLLESFSHVTDVQVHVDPYDPGYPYKSNHDPNQDHMPTLLQ